MATVATIGTAETIVAFLRRNGPAYTATIARRYGRPARAMIRECRRLEAAGEIAGEEVRVGSERTILWTALN